MQIIIIILCAYIVLGQILLLLVGEYVETTKTLFWIIMILFCPIGTLTSFLMVWHKSNVEKRVERKKVKNNE